MNVCCSAGMVVNIPCDRDMKYREIRSVREGIWASSEPEVGHGFRWLIAIIWWSRILTRKYLEVCICLRHDCWLFGIIADFQSAERS
jgi:hypothetical protein